MRILRYYFIFLLTYTSLPAQDAQVIHITEEDQDGNSRNNDGNAKESYVNAKITDINSTLNIDLDRNILMTKLGASIDAKLPNDLSQKLMKLRQVMKSRNESLKNLERIAKLYDYTSFKNNTAAYDSYISQLQLAVAKLEEIAEIDERIEEKALEYDDLYGSVYQAAEFVFDEISLEFQEYANKKGVHVQFGGWLIAKGRRVPVHLQGFDSIAPQKPFEVERWQFLPTEEQLEELELLTQYARENRGMEDRILREIAKNQLEQLRDIGDAKIQELQRKVTEELAAIKETLGTAITPRVSAIVQEIEVTGKLVEDFIKEIHIRKKYYEDIISGSPFSIEELIFRLDRDLRFVTKEKGKEIRDQIVKVNNVFNASTESTLQEVKSLYKELVEKLTVGFSTFSNTATDNIRIFLYGKDLDLAALTFSDKVLSLSLDRLPASTSLQLIDTGVRKDGDQLAFKLEVRSKKGVIYSENRKIFMYRVLPHIEGTVGVIFADPLARTNIQTQFQMAPYYNMILKGLWDQKLRRKSVPYNRIFDWGIGLHISAPDFDGDDVPEIGAGVVISILHDYIQSGAAINVFTGDPYWFFGLRLPVPSFNIGGSSLVSE